MSDHDETIIDDVERPCDESAVEDLIDEPGADESPEMVDDAPVTQDAAEERDKAAAESTESASSTSDAPARDDVSDVFMSLNPIRSKLRTIFFKTFGL